MWRKPQPPAPARPVLRLSSSSLLPLSPSQMLHYTQKIRFTAEAQEEVFFTQVGEMPATFDIKNTSSQTRVGRPRWLDILSADLLLETSCW